MNVCSCEQCPCWRVAFPDDGTPLCDECYVGEHLPAPIRATAVSVVWREAHRIEPLVARLAERFDEVVVVVQDSPDDTLAICKRVLTGDRHHVVEDKWRGGGDFSMPLALSYVTNEWAFVISGDEWPDDELLASMPNAITTMETNGNSGAFIEFSEYIDGVEYVEHGRHVRLFRAAGGWEARHHSAAPHENTIQWKVGHIVHTRTLDDVFSDYLRKLTMMENEATDPAASEFERNRASQLVAHNVNTLFNVSNLIAAAKGWRHVWASPQWSEVERRVFRHAPRSMELL